MQTCGHYQGAPAGAGPAGRPGHAGLHQEEDPGQLQHRLPLPAPPRTQGHPGRHPPGWVLLLLCDCADCGLLRRVRHPEGRRAVPCGARRPELRQHAGGRHPPRPRPAAPHAQLRAHRGRGGRGFLLELQTKARKDFTIMEKASTWAFSGLKAATIAFTFKTLC